VERNGDDDEEEIQQRLKTAADVSIARQISVSRSQRQLLIPIKTSSQNSKGQKGGNPNFPSPGNGRLDRSERVVSPTSGNGARVGSPVGLGGGPRVVKMGLNERLVERKPLTPTIVVVSGNRGNRKGRSSEGREGEAKDLEELNGGVELQHRKSERIVIERA